MACLQEAAPSRAGLTADDVVGLSLLLCWEIAGFIAVVARRPYVPGSVGNETILDEESYLFEVEGSVVEFFSRARLVRVDGSLMSQRCSVFDVVVHA